MGLVSMSEMLGKAKAGGYAVAAFNVENMEMIQAVTETAARLNAPVILQTTPSTVKYASLGLFRAMAEEEAGHLSIPVALHLDHGDSVELCGRALEARYPSVMFDGSKLPFGENAALTRQVVEAARRLGVSVEGELGTVSGKEDSHTAAKVLYTEPEEAAEFARRTGVSALAVAIGTAHGFYKGEPKLDYERLRQIAAVVDTPIVLHGASGLADEAVRRCVELGVCKVNFATELRDAFSRGARNALEDQRVYDPKVYLGEGRLRVAGIVEHKIGVCGCADKA